MGAGRDLYAVRKDGREVPVEIGLTPVIMPEGLFTLATITDITERKRKEEELRRTAEELARSNQDLEQFAYVASHDLQEPLRMVSGFLLMLQEQYKGKMDATADEYIRFAVEGALRMQDLVKGLLAYARLGSRIGEFAPVHCQEVMDSAFQNLQAAITESEAQIECDPLPVLVADKTQMVQLFQNLLSNAIKFRGDERRLRIRIRAQEQPDGWVFSVEDNGIGFDPQFAQDVFRVFRRVHARSRYPGTGIGLAICKRIVERHGGRIWAESQPGQGSAFRFTFPHGRASP